MVDSIVGWVEGTKPNKPRKPVLGFAIALPQPTNFSNIIRTYAETGFLNQNSGFCHFLLTRNPVSRAIWVSPNYFICSILFRFHISQFNLRRNWVGELKIWILTVLPWRENRVSRFVCVSLVRLKVVADVAVTPVLGKSRNPPEYPWIPP